MVNGLTGSAASPLDASSQTASAQAVQPNVGSQNAAKAVPQADSVSLSVPAQAHAMQQQGMNVKTIAANLGTTIRPVNSYLGDTSNITGGGGSGAITELKNIAANVRVNPPAGGIPPAR